MENLSGLSFDMSTLIASFLFGIVGLVIFRRGRKRFNNKLVLIGVGLMVYPFFIEGPLTTWAVGFALSGFAYYFWWA